MQDHLTGKWLNETLGLRAKHALYREDGVWYHHLKSFPGVLFDSNGYLIVNTQDDYEGNPKFRRTKALTIKDGIGNIEGYALFTEEQRNLILIENIISDDVIEEQTVRRLRQSEIIVRNRKLVKKVKVIYSDHCQMCNLQLKIADNVFYSEVHHIVPLGAPHDGKDILSNMICVCPNCHVLLDLGAIKLVPNNILMSKHKISKEYLQYHNSTIYNSILKRLNSEEVQLPVIIFD